MDSRPPFGGDPCTCNFSAASLGRRHVL